MNHFKVRIKHYGREYYLVQYSTRKYLPNWKSVMTYIDHMGYTYDLEGWTEQLFKIDDAEKFAAELTPESLEEYNKKEEMKEIKYNEKKAEYIKRNIPYKTKNI